MRKSLYSIMIESELIDAIDELATKRAVDRSYILNEILSEYLSVKIPQINLKEIFQMIELNMNTSAFKVNTSLSDCLINVKSSIEHEYRPALKYCVEIYDKDDIKIGRLKLIYRTYDLNALRKFNNFIDIWISLESHYIHRFFPNNSIKYDVDSGRFSRILMLPKYSMPVTNEILSKGISDYIKEFDELFKLCLNSNEFDVEKIEKRYMEYINKAIIL